MQRIGKFGCCLVAGVALGVSAASLEVNQVKQRYPWNGLVDIDYTIALGAGEKFTADDNLEVVMIDKSVTPAVTNRAACFLQAPLPMTAGAHRITWDANYDGVTNYTDNAEFIVKIAHYAPTYMVIDVSEGSKEDAIYRVDFLNGEPVGGFNVSEYKLNKIVLRRIHPGSYMAGSPSGETGHDSAETQHRVAISKPFYIGVFEVTRRQYYKVLANSEVEEGDRPVSSVSYNAFRSDFATMLSQKCRSKDPETGDYTVPVASPETGHFDLPTEFQWEYACRAGTTTPFNGADSSGTIEEQLARVGRYAGNKNDGKGGYATHTTVGMYDPNAWGLYDMHGNVWEWCLDWYVGNVTGLNQYVDPTGPGTGGNIVIRGGSYGENVNACRSAKRAAYAGPGSAFADWGFRLALTCRKGVAQ